MWLKLSFDMQLQKVKTKWLFNVCLTLISNNKPLQLKWNFIVIKIFHMLFVKFNLTKPEYHRMFNKYRFLRNFGL